MSRMLVSARSVDRSEQRPMIAPLGHLIPRKQKEIKRAVRILEAYFVDQRPRAPRRGTLLRIVLVGPYAQPSDRPDFETGQITEYEFWAFVDHSAYKGLNRYWGQAREMLARELGGRAAITLSVFTMDEIDRARSVGNRFLVDKYDGGVVIHDKADIVYEANDDRR